MSVKRIIATAAAGLATILALPSQSFAGASWESEVYVGSNYASGNMGSAYHSADSTQYIGFYVSVSDYSSNTWTSVVCQARDANNNSFFCSAGGEAAEAFAQALATASSESALYVAANSGTCTTVLVQTRSQNPPK